MFGKNKPLSVRAFEGKEYEVKVVDIFPTIQGEGPFSGYPAVFVRLAHCNLSCPFCDTDFEDGKWMWTEAVSERVRSIISSSGFKHGPPVVVITGGEPTLQRGLPNLMDSLFENLIDHVHCFQLETNGVLEFKYAKNRFIVVLSPKANPATGSYIHPHPNSLSRADYLKVLIDAEVRPYDEIPDFVFGYVEKEDQPWRVTLSPITHYLPTGEIDRERNRRNYEKAVEMAIRYGFRLSVQSHLILNIP